ncbi:FMN reductase [Geotalea uraniireducens]|uniref:FMN reductase n=1 Tax=Geotalea uraniireducens TaxID=351604 RepID=A0ABM8EMP2_9BACT|nr:flavodoxin family protein [Geotalea uraniireducens]BDV43845.1 FMN reductase [Geotalea uraniireducens]
MATIAIVYHSTYGHTAGLAQSVAAGAARVGGVRVELVPVAEIENRWEVLHGADAMIFGCPTYMGSGSADFKKFMEATAHFWLEQRWKDKLAAGFTNSASQSGDKLNTLVQLAIFAAQHGMLWVSLGLLPGNNASTASIADLNRLGSFMGAMAQSNNDQGPEAVPPANDHETAALLGQRVAELALRFKR